MILICRNNNGFEDALSQGRNYPVEAVGVNSYFIKNDRSEYEWYGKMHFDIAFTPDRVVDRGVAATMQE